jgi:hypothetical protein
VERYRREESSRGNSGLNAGAPQFRMEPEKRALQGISTASHFRSGSTSIPDVQNCPLFARQASTNSPESPGMARWRRVRFASFRQVPWPGSSSCNCCAETRSSTRYLRTPFSPARINSPTLHLFWIAPASRCHCASACAGLISGSETRDML